MTERLRALRGATTVEVDQKQDIIDATSELIEQMMERNEVAKEDLVSIIFTATPDLTSEFPAAAARAKGISDIPLLCAAEVDVAGAIPRVIRVLMHLYSSTGPTELRHVYLREAKPLRTDLHQ
ncbi:MAG TPA: chorismate mutase [Actinomycetota bacterium]|nr:chorismate mutase [Actinomycetota bacterium]